MARQTVWTSFDIWSPATRLLQTQVSTGATQRNNTQVHGVIVNSKVTPVSIWRSWDSSPFLSGKAQDKLLWQQSKRWTTVEKTLYKPRARAEKIFRNGKWVWPKAKPWTVAEKVLVNGKWVWKRVPVTTTRWVKVRRKTGSGSKSKGRPLDLNPNYLNFTREYQFDNGERSVTVVSGDTKFVTTGYLFGGFRWYHQGPTIGDDVQSWDNAATGLIDSLTANANELANHRFLSKVADQSVNLQNMLGERAQTAGMLVETVTMLVKGMKALKRGDLKQAWQSFVPSSKGKALGNYFLMYHYGVKPLVSDIEAILAELTTPKAQSWKVRASAISSLDNVVIASGGNQGVCSTSWRLTASIRVKVIYQTRITAQPILRDLSRLGIGNLAQTLYELTPYSFVVDWFLPIGRFLSENDAYNGVVVDRTFKTTVVELTQVYERSFGGTIAGVTTSGETATRTKELFTVKREILTAPPRPLFPKFKNPFSIYHFGIASSLFLQKMKTTKTPSQEYFNVRNLLKRLA